MTALDPARSGSKPFTCLIVEDDPAFAGMAAEVVREEGGVPTFCATIAEAQRVIAGGQFDLILLDNHLPDGRGCDLFAQIARRDSETPTLMITGVPDLAEAVSLTRNGLFDYLTKPVSVESLSACLQRARLRVQTGPAPRRGAEWFGDSPAMLAVSQQLRQAAAHPSTTVLLTGETGTGKELAARRLHQLTYQGAESPFIPVNCGAIPSEMFESELFGAERGAFTGADKRRTGLAAAASGGTLFLDEIAEVPLALQAKLLRLLESREFRSLGSTESESFAGRFVAATNKSLADEVKAGRFREDLLYRLDVFSIELPPLRRRRADIHGLTEFLLAELAGRYGRPKPLLKPEDLTALANYHFPGNVRELRNVLERSLLKTASSNRWLNLDVNWIPRDASTLATDGDPPAVPTASPAVCEREGLTPIEAQEYRLIQEALHDAHGGIRRAAARLGLSPQALLRRLDKWPELRPSRN